VRPIKFRAWDKWGKKMYQEVISINIIGVNGTYHSVNNPEGLGGLLNIDGAELQQFTGLLDKNGKEIYEGDIIKNDIDRLWVIEWDKELCMFCQILYSTTGKILERMDLRFNAKEVIGNIYENPELLKE